MHGTFRRAAGFLPRSRRARSLTGMDGSSRASAAERLEALRAELSRRGLDGFIVPRADEHQGEYVPAGAPAARLADRLHRLGRAAIVLADSAAVFVDGRYTLQAAAQVDAALFEIRHLIEEPPAEWLAGSGEAGRRASATTRGCTRRTRSSGCAPAPSAPARRCARSKRNPVDRGLAGPAGAAARSRRAAPGPFRRRERRRQARPRSADAADRGRGRRGGADRCRNRSPGCSTSAAATCRTRRCRCPSRSCATTAASRCSSTARKLAPDARRHLGNEVTVEPPGRVRPGARRAGGIGRTGAGRSRRPPRHGCSTGSAGRARRCTAPPTRACCRKPARTGSRSTAPAPRIAATARRVTRFLAWLAREAPQGRAARDRRQRPARSVPPRGRAFPRSELPDHLGRRVERRDRALPRNPGDREARSNRARSICSIPERSISTAPPTSPARSRSARPTPEMRDRFTRVLKGHIALATARFPKRHDRARSSTRSRAARCGRRGSTTTTAPATASAAISACTKGRSASRRRRTRSRCCPA